MPRLQKFSKDATSIFQLLWCNSVKVLEMKVPRRSVPSKCKVCKAFRRSAISKQCGKTWSLFQTSTTVSISWWEYCSWKSEGCSSMSLSACVAKSFNKRSAKVLCSAVHTLDGEYVVASRMCRRIVRENFARALRSQDCLISKLRFVRPFMICA